MSKTLAQMQANVGAMVQDTSTTFATLILNWLNDKYLDIARRHSWSVLINFDYTITEVSGIASYTLPTDFDEEIFVADVNDGKILRRYTEGLWWRARAENYSGGTITQGTPDRYIILQETNSFFLDPTPNVTHTLSIPYKKSITALSLSADIPVIKNIEPIMELGATSEAQAYKRQFQKAAYYLQRYEVELARRIGQEKSAPNQMYQWVPSDASSVNARLTGDLSYDSL